MADFPADSPAAHRRSRGLGGVLLTLAGLGSAFAVASCCALPLLLAAAGLGAAWLGSIAEIAAPYRAPLLALSAASLAGGGIQLWRQRKSGYCSPAAVCARPAARRATALGLLVGLVMLYLGYAYV
jgi:mercuric ion transport protein